MSSIIFILQGEKFKMGTIQCQNCGKRILEKEHTCPHCGHQNNTKGQTPAKNETGSMILGYIGASLMFLGVFLPAIELPLGKSLTYLNGGKGDGTFLILISILAFYYVFRQSRRGLFVSGLTGVLLIGVDLIQTTSKVAEHKNRLAASSNFARIIGDVSVGYGFAVMSLGAILVIIAAMMINKNTN